MGFNKNWLVAFFGFCSISCDSESNQASKNADNLEQVSMGMHMTEVLSLMGKPKEIQDTPSDSSTIELVYTSPTGMSDHYRIRISKEDSIAVYIGNGL
jgi:hypothetical protein